MADNERLSGVLVFAVLDELYGRKAIGDELASIMHDDIDTYHEIVEACAKGVQKVLDAWPAEERSSD
jgi:hypothetical protein